MVAYLKMLEYPLNITKKDLKMAKLIASQYGGPQGELGAAIRYLNQRLTMPDDYGRSLLNDIGIEELAHIEMLQTMMMMLMKDATIEEIKAAGVEGYGVKSGDTVAIDGVDLPVYEAEYSNYSFDGRAYDVKAVMTPSQETYLDGTDEKAYNAQGIPEISVMDDSRDAVYVEDKNARFDIIDENADSLGMKAEELLNACRTEYRFAVKENHGRYTVMLPEIQSEHPRP